MPRLIKIAERMLVNLRHVRRAYVFGRPLTIRRMGCVPMSKDRHSWATSSGPATADASLRS